MRFVLLFLLLSVYSSHAELLTLVSKDGRVIKAELIEVDEKQNIVFKRENGQRFTLPFSHFAEESLVTISRAWTKVLDARPLEVPVPKWKILFVIYPSIDTTLGSREIKTTMGSGRLKEFTNLGDRIEKTMEDWANEKVTFQVDTKIMSTPLAKMSPVRGSYWPKPDDVREDLQDILKEGLYDSLVIGLDRKAFNPSYAGLGLTSTPSDRSLGVTYALSVNAGDETFIHEWMHGSCAYVRNVLKSDCPDPHDNGKFGVTKENGGWSHWYKMMMRNEIPRSETEFAGFSDESWDKGGPYYKDRVKQAKRERRKGKSISKPR